MAVSIENTNEAVLEILFTYDVYASALSKVLSFVTLKLHSMLRQTCYRSIVKPGKAFLTFLARFPLCAKSIPRAYRVRRTREHATSMLRVETSK